MTNITLSKKEFEKQVPLTEDIIEKINLLGIPVEQVKDEEIIIDVLPNRPDALSFPGFMRALKAYIGKESGLKEYKINKPLPNYKVKIDPSTKNIRPYTACAIVKNLNFDEEKIKQVIDIQEKLHSTIGRNRKKLAIGIYPLEKITLPITFKAERPSEIKFIPLEESREMNGKEILDKHPTGKEYAHLLEGYELFPVFRDAKGKVLSMPPIINSQETGKITYDTKEVFIECSGFNLPLLKKTLNILVTHLADTGGEVYAMELEYPKKEMTPDLTTEKMKISLENTNKLLGLNLKEKDLEKLLPKMGYSYKKGIVEIPAWRADILHEVDIIEDIAIAYGYNNLEPEIPQTSTIGEESMESRIQSRVAELLTGLNLTEISTYHLIKSEEAKMHKISEELEVLESKCEYKLLRPNLLIPALRILTENKDAEYPQKIFEIGTTFTPDAKSETRVREEDHLLIASTPGNATEMKQILDYLTKNLALTYTIKETETSECIPGRTVSILINNKEIGYFGEIHPQTLKNWGLKMPLTVLEISLNEIYNNK